MKKIFVLLLAAVMLFSLAACGKKAAAQAPETEEPAGPAVVGGWTRPESPAIPAEAAEALEKALDGLVGAKYTPVAYLGSQLVAGTNYKLLCGVAPVVPDPVETWAVVTVYKDLQGKASIIDVQESGIPTDLSKGLMGGWSAPETPELTAEIREAFDKATEKLLGVNYEPLAVVGQQVVSGMNYRILCEATAVAPGAEPAYAIVTVYRDTAGSAEVTDVANFAAAE